MIHIGIDPDMRKPGVAIIQNGVYTSIQSMTNVELFALIEKHRGLASVMWHVEDVNAVSATYFRPRHGAVSKQAVQDNISQKVGMVKALGTVIIDVLDYYACNYELVKPLRGPLKKAKHEAELFKQLTGWEGRTNQDSRDAAMLIFRFMGKAA